MWFDEEEDRQSAADLRLNKVKEFVREPMWVRCREEGLPPHDFYGIVQVEKSVWLKKKYNMPDRS